MSYFRPMSESAVYDAIVNKDDARLLTGAMAALHEVLTVIECIDFVADASIDLATHEEQVRMQAVKSCSARIQRAAEVFIPAIEAVENRAEGVR